jgi:hypothetical protein
VWPTYVCQRRGIARAESICQSIPGRGRDHAIGRVLLETVTPLTLEITLTVQQELQTRLDETDRLHRRGVERARYEADLARRRYLQVDPANRLVADELEAHWNRALQQVTEAQEIYERQRHANRVAVDADTRARILALATDVPRLWHDPHTPDRERKRMVRLLMDDVTLIKTTDGVTAHIRFRGGATTSLTLPAARNAWQLRETSAEIVSLIDQLLDTHTDGDIATLLNARGYVSGNDQRFHRRIVLKLRRSHGLRSRDTRLRDRGMLTPDEIATRLDVCVDTVKIWGRTAYFAATAATTKANTCTSRRARTPPSRCRVDVCRIADGPTSSRIRPTRCSMKRSPSLGRDVQQSVGLSSDVSLLDRLVRTPANRQADKTPREPFLCPPFDSQIAACHGSVPDNSNRRRENIPVTWVGEKHDARFEALSFVKIHHAYNIATSRLQWQGFHVGGDRRILLERRRSVRQTSAKLHDLAHQIDGLQ